eukprot:888051-Rhodomonas_salina.1
MRRKHTVLHGLCARWTSLRLKVRCPICLDSPNASTCRGLQTAGDHRWMTLRRERIGQTEAR